MSSALPTTGVLRAAALTVLALLISACSLSGTREVVQYYTLDEPGENAAVAPPDARRLAVEAFTAPGHLDQLQMIRRLDAASPAFELYSETHRWGQVPREMATELALRHFRHTLRSVELYPADERVELVLSLRLVRFEELRAPGATTGTARVHLDGRLVVLDAGGTTVRDIPIAVASERPTAHPGGDTDHAGVARALRAALVLALDQVVARIPPP